MEYIKWAVMPFIVAIFGSWIGSQMTLMRFKRERLWQVKYQAYSDIIEAVHKVNYWASEYERYDTMLPSSSIEKLQALQKDYDESMEQIDRYSKIGSLVISADTVALTKEIMTSLHDECCRVNDEQPDPDDPAPLVEHYSKIAQITKKFLPKLIEVAKKDIRSKTWPF